MPAYADCRDTQSGHKITQEAEGVPATEPDAVTSSCPGYPSTVTPPPAAFYFDLASPLAYLAAERVLHELPVPAEWQPVLARDLRAPTTESLVPAPTTESLVGEGLPAHGCEEEHEGFRAELVRRAAELGLQPVRWPDPFPFDSSMAMRVATYAKSIGRVVPFAQAAFRQAFAGGRSLADESNVLIAAAACEMHPAAVLRGAELRSVTAQLADATERAAQSKIIKIPAIVVEDTVFEGERAIERAAARMRERSLAGQR
jgi:2-hydroxychromene-2-carboxylate isomerase